jgi:hypothetical protein
VRSSDSGRRATPEARIGSDPSWTLRRRSGKHALQIPAALRARVTAGPVASAAWVQGLDVVTDGAVALPLDAINALETAGEMRPHHRIIIRSTEQGKATGYRPAKWS